MSEREKYSNVCNKYDLPVFMQDWWMDAVCGRENWQPVMALDGAEEVEAAMLCYIYRKWGKKVIIPAPFSPFCGIWFRPTHQLYKRYSEEQRILDLCTQLISNLPEVIFFVQQFHFTFQNWLAFYWKGFKQSTKYTYILKDLSDLDKIQAEFKGSTRTAIKKAEATLHIESSDDAECIYGMVGAELGRRGVRLPLSKSGFLRLDAELSARESRKIYYACDDAGHKHAAVYTIWDKNTTYLLLTAINRTHQNTTALSFLIWKAIQDAASRGNSFDFEGSSLPHIEPFFRSFGGERKSYFRISKAKNKVWDLLFFLAGKG